MMRSDAAKPLPAAIVIAGMHRSATSLAASLVATAGVHIGDRLLGPERGNVRGHYEDLDFYELHQRALASAGLGTEGYTSLPVIPLSPAVSDAFDALAERKRSRRKPWGWKDPRTTLFLDAWCEKLPEARFLLVFRRPWEVLDSLFRRGDTVFCLNPRLAVDVWVSYNRRIHDFALAHAERCLLVETTRVVRDPRGMIAALGRIAGLELAPPADCFEPTLLVGDDAADRKHLVHRMRPDAIDLYEALRGLAGEPVNMPLSRTDIDSDHLVDAATMQWMRTARAESERDELGRRLEEAERARNAAVADAHAARRLRRALSPSRIARECRRVVRQILGFVGLSRDSSRSGRS